MDYCLKCKDCITRLVEKYGEIHVYVEEHDSVAGDEPIGLRDGPRYTYLDEAVKIETNGQKRFVPYSRIVFAEEAVGFPD